MPNKSTESTEQPTESTKLKAFGGAISAMEKSTGRVYVKAISIIAANTTVARQIAKREAKETFPEDEFIEQQGSVAGMPDGRYDVKVFARW
jgi:hypothetical protein